MERKKHEKLEALRVANNYSFMDMAQMLNLTIGKLRTEIEIYTMILQRELLQYLI